MDAQVKFLYAQKFTFNHRFFTERLRHPSLLCVAWQNIKPQEDSQKANVVWYGICQAYILLLILPWDRSIFQTLWDFYRTEVIECAREFLWVYAFSIKTYQNRLKICIHVGYWAHTTFIKLSFWSPWYATKHSVPLVIYIVMLLHRIILAAVVMRRHSLGPGKLI